MSWIANGGLGCKIRETQIFLKMGMRQRQDMSRKTYFLRAIPTLTHYIFWHSFWHTIWKYIWHTHTYIYIYIHTFWHSIWHSFWYIFWHSKSIWYSFWHMYLAYLLTFFLALYLVYLRRFLVVEVRRRTLWSGARRWGPAGSTLIRSLRWRSSRERPGNTLIRSLRWRSGHFDPEVAVGVRRGTLRSRACSWGPAGITLIQRLLFGSGGEHCDVARAYSWIPAGITLMQGLLFGSGGEHCDLELAVEVRRRKEEDELT